MKKVYLAGGLKSAWQDDFIQEGRGHFELIDPRSHGLPDPVAYTEWDLAGVRAADLVVSQMDSTNPSGYGLSIEIGYAHALGKPIIFIDQIAGDWRSRYFGMHRVMATSVVSSVNEAVLTCIDLLGI